MRISWLHNLRMLSNWALYLMESLTRYLTMNVVCMTIAAMNSIVMGNSKRLILILHIHWFHWRGLMLFDHCMWLRNESIRICWKSRSNMGFTSLQILFIRWCMVATWMLMRIWRRFFALRLWRFRSNCLKHLCKQYYCRMLVLFLLLIFLRWFFEDLCKF